MCELNPWRRAGFLTLSLILALRLAAAAAASSSPADPDIASFLAGHGQAPLDYILARAQSHRVTILGEAHWLRQDAELVASLVPALEKATIDLAAEILPASEQPRIDALTAAPQWNEPLANAILRKAAWPYREYRDILRAAWSANRDAKRAIRILALGPPPDWRDVLLPRGQTYDSFMADLVARHVESTGRPIVVYCGMHHAFTRYYQAELDLKGRASAYMDRMGNILSRRFGEKVFLVALHKPIWRGDPEKPDYGLPFGGRLDCAASKAGGAVGFDVVATPLAELRFAPDDYYSLGHPGLRFVDYTDGYVWTGPLESFRQASIIPLEEFAPDAAALAELRHANPFTDDQDISLETLTALWAREIQANEDVLAKRSWKGLASWRSMCR